MILHVGTLSRFIPPFMEFVRDEFDHKEHFFWLTGSVDKYPVKEAGFVYICASGLWNRIRGYAKLIFQLHTADKILLHGLFSTQILVILAFCPWRLKKCYWMILGGDLYRRTRSSKRLSIKVVEAVRFFVISKLGHLVTYIEGDIALARAWYGAKGVHHECIMYLSNVVSSSFGYMPLDAHGEREFNILLGNSADPTNNHVETMGRLTHYSSGIKIYAPLSYGNSSYAQQVVELGRETFGDRFIPMTDYMSYEEYVKFLEGIDIAVFNHRRQQAMGNTIMLLCMGKTVYMRSDVSQWQLFSRLGVELRDVAVLDLKLIPRDVALRNSRIIRAYFSRENLIKQLSDIFEG